MSLRTSKQIVALVLIVAASVGTATAHHSFAMFERKVLGEVSGTVKQLQWTNPHVYIDLVSVDDQGTTTWTLEAGGPLQLESTGLKRDSIKPGDKITVRMHPLKNGAPGGQIVSIKTANGKLYELDKLGLPNTDPNGTPAESKDSKGSP
jgi:hypothetical protein